MQQMMTESIVASGVLCNNELGWEKLLGESGRVYSGRVYLPSQTLSRLTTA